MRFQKQSELRTVVRAVDSTFSGLKAVRGVVLPSSLRRVQSPLPAQTLSADESDPETANHDECWLDIPHSLGMTFYFPATALRARCAKNQVTH
jgi:hypothetical protein